MADRPERQSYFKESDPGKAARSVSISRPSGPGNGVS